MKKQGFTLAEVLITLVVIGVVAALSIPTLMAKYQEHVLSVKLKKVNSILQQATKLMFTDNGCSAGDVSCLGWNDKTNLTMDGKTFNFIYSKQAYILSKQFKKSKLVIEQNNFPATKYKTTEQGSGGYSTTSATGFTTDDGVCILKERSLLSNDETPIIVDINCSKGPNIFGKDLFFFWMVSKEGEKFEPGTLFMYGTKQFSEYEGNSSYYWRNTNCSNKKDTTAAYVCGARYLEM